MRRAAKTRSKISDSGNHRISIHRSIQHIYLQLITPNGDKVITTISTNQKDNKTRANNIKTATDIGIKMADYIKKAKITILTEKKYLEIFSNLPFVSDLRTGAMSGGSGEQGLLSAACAQMLAHFNLPSGAAAGMCDSKLPDAQSGYEKGSTAVMAGLAGLNLVYESAGMHASLLGFSLESMVIDNDMLGQCLRCVRGIEVNPETLSFDAIKEVCLEGPGHYLGHDRTLAVMESEYVYPDISDRSSPKEWKENDNPEIIDTAHKEVTNILDNQKSNHISNEIDREIRKKFKIHFTN